MSLQATGAMTFSGNTVYQNNTYPIKAYADNVGSIVNGCAFNDVNSTSYLEVSGNTITKDATWTAAIPYVISGYLTVQGVDGADATTTLTLAPGAVLKFNQSRYLNIGSSSGNPGALIAHGTSAYPIVFTSNQAAPTAGYWNNILINNTSSDSTTLSHCIFEFGGGGGQGMLNLSDAKPTISYCIFRNSSHAGIYVTGSGSTGATIRGNTFVSNLYGLYVSSSLPEIRENNFNGNTNYGIYFTGSGTLSAENNWWGSSSGPNTSGDRTYGNVDADPWSSAENFWMAPGENHPPNVPSIPSPADNTIRVPLVSGAINLQWAGGDPDALDTVQYDLYRGTSAENMSVLAQNIAATNYSMNSAGSGTTYYWQIIAKDNRGMQTPGPVWRFSTEVGLPDLIVTALSTDPAGHLLSGQTATITATIQNIGNAPVEEGFDVNFSVDGVSIGATTTNAAIASGGSIQVSHSWAFGGGNPSIQVRADSQSVIVETNEANNSYTVTLSGVADIAAPVLISTSPADGATPYEIQRISVILSDSKSSINDAAVMASFAVVNGIQQPIVGAVSEANDTFTFVPGGLPLPVDSYQVTLTAVDTFGNAQTYTFGFRIVEKPPEPTVVGGTISTDTVWTLTGSPYIVTSNITVQGNDGADGITTLTIQPGVVVKFNQYSYLNIGAASGNPGALIAQGTASASILFTSNQTAPTAGYWNNIQIANTANDATTVLEHCTIQYAGGGGQGALNINGAAPTLRNVTIANSSTHGVYMTNGTPIIGDCQFNANGNYDLYYSGTIGGSLTGTTINNGIYLLGTGTMALSDNTVHYNNSYPIKAYADSVGAIVSGCDFTNVTSASYLEVNNGNITKDATWTAAIAYLMTGNTTVQGTDGADGITTLTIAPGAVVKFNQYRYLNIGASSGNPGALIAQGTSAAPILFTSNQTTPTAGYWNNIQIANTANDATTVLEHCTIQYAGGGGQGALNINGAAPTLSNITIANSSSHGIYMTNGTPIIGDCQFNANGNYDLYYSGTIGGSLTGSTIRNGLYLLGTGTVALSGNTVNYNNAFPIKAYADTVGAVVSGCAFTNVTSASYLEVNNGNITKDATWTADIAYVMTGNTTVQGTDGADGITTLTIAPGAVVKFNQYRNLNIGASSGNPGALIAQGTSAAPILFTSNQTTPTAGYWNNIQIANTANDATTILEYCTIQYGGSGSQGALYISNASPSVRGCTLRYNTGRALYISGIGCNYADIRANTFTGNAYGIYLDSNAQPSIRFNNFDGNTSHGLYNASSILVIAENNWWGDALGPNTGGDKTYGNVDAAPWMGEPNNNTGGGANSAPIAVADAAATPEDNPIAAIAVLANDGDPDGDTLSVTAFSQPAHGTVTDNHNGTLAYAPASNYNGTDTFTYTVSDGDRTAIATVSIIVQPVNDPPTANAGPDQNVNRGITVTLDGRTSSDADGNTVTYNWSLFSRPEGSTATLSSETIATPLFVADAAGLYEIQLRVSDGVVFSEIDTLRVIATIPVVTVPNITGLALPQAELLLAQSELTTGALNREYSDTVAQDHVIRQNPAAGVSIEIGSRVDLVVSRGPLLQPTVSLNASPSLVAQGSTTILTWTSTSAETVSIDNGLGAVPLNGAVELMPAQTTTYTITAANPAGSATRSVTVEVRKPPVATLSILPQSVQSGQPVTLAWQTQNTESVTIDHGIGAVGAAGTIITVPDETTVYTLTATGTGVSVTATAMVTISFPEPTIDFHASPESIVRGQFTQLTWATTNADSCTIDRGIGNVPTFGGITLSPDISTTYTITAQNRGGSVTARATVSVVADPPTVQASAQERTISPGASTVLNWQTTHAERCTIEPGIGEVNLNGGVTVTPAEDTTYTITAYGSGVSARTSVRVCVNYPSLGLINTIAGSDTYGYSGDSGPAVMAEMNLPTDIAIDHEGNVYFIDSQNYRIRKIDTRGIISNFAGSAGGYSGDGGPALQAEIIPMNIAADGIGNIYFSQADTAVCFSSTSEAQNHVRFVRRVDPNGIITTIFSSPDKVGGMVADDVGNLYVSLGSMVQKIKPDGTTENIAGNGTAGFAGDGGLAVNARLRGAEALCLDRKGSLFINDRGNGRIRRVDNNGIIITVAGGGMLQTDNIPALEAALYSSVRSMAVDADGNIYLLQEQGGDKNLLKKITTDGYLTTINDTQIDITARSIGDGKTVPEARLVYPTCIRIDRSGNWYIAEAPAKYEISIGDYGCPEPPATCWYPGVPISWCIGVGDYFAKSSRIRKVAPPAAFPVLIVTPADGLVSFSDHITLSGFVRPGAQVHMNGVEATVQGDTFSVTVPLSEGHNRILAQASIAGDTIGYDATDIDFLPEYYGILEKALEPEKINEIPGYICECPPDVCDLEYAAEKITTDNQGNIYLPLCHSIFKIDPLGNWQVIAGNGTSGFSGDGGPAVEATLLSPMGIAVGPDGTVFFADTGNHRIRKVGPDGIITTVAGTGIPYRNGNSRPGLQMNLYNPWDVALAPDGSLYIADTFNYRVLKLGTNGICSFFTGETTQPTVNVGFRPTGLDIDDKARLFISDDVTNIIWRMDGGVRTPVAGGACPDWGNVDYGDGGPAIDACLFQPNDVAVGTDGTLYINDAGNKLIRRVGADGIIRTMVGYPAVFSDYPIPYNYDNFGDGGPAQLGQVDQLTSLAVSAGGVVYFSDFRGNIKNIKPPLPPTTISGRITDAESGSPLSNVTVAVEWMNEVYTSSTGADGEFALTNVHAVDGTLHIAVLAPGYIIRNEERLITGGSLTAPLEIRMKRRPPLTLDLTLPEENAETVISQTPVAGSTSHPVRITIDGLEVRSAGTDFIESVALREGPNTITVSAQDAYGQSASIERQVTHAYQNPVVAIQASATQILRDQSVLLTWSSANATGVRIEPGIGPVAPSGTISVSPAQTTTYTISADNPPWKAMASTTVAVTQTEPVRLRATPQAIDLGQKATLMWSCREDFAGTVTITPGIGTVGPVGSKQVAPRGTTTYTITATGTGGTATASVTLDVNLLPPVVAFSADSLSVPYNGYSTLTWSTQLADSVRLDGQAVSLNGNRTYINIRNTTECTLTATGPGGTTTRKIIIEVMPTNNQPPSAYMYFTPVDDWTQPLTLTYRLSWIVENADNVNIDNGVGKVPTVASALVYPDETTTYTLTASGPGGSTTASVVIPVVPPPTINYLVANPAIITPGASTTLRWAVGNAESVSINNGIGTVSPLGELQVSPSQTTTYTLTARGAVVTRQKTVTVTVQAAAPTAILSATPPSIAVGESSTLSWTTGNAETVTIDNGVGALSTSGSMQVSPQSTTTYRLTAAGAGGTTTATATVTVDNPFTLTIEAPTDGQVIQRPDVLVRGSFANSAGRETGITVNGITALQYLNEFMANHVPLIQGENTLTVTATDTDGRTYNQSITVTAEITGQYCTATVTPEAGLDPYEGELRIAAPAELSRSEVLAYGWGSVTYGQGPPDFYPLTIDGPGLYRLTVEATARDGRVFTDETAVLVYDRDQLDALLQAKWNAMKARLAAGDVPGAVSYYSSATRRNYEEIFTAIGDQLPQVVEEMRGIEMIDVHAGQAKYRLTRSEEILGQHYEITYNIYFFCAENGIWKILRY
jgi:sugar lactone lactonase YvrE